MALSLAQKLVNLGMVTPLAKELAAQQISGVYNWRRLAGLSMVPVLAKLIAIGSYSPRAGMELGLTEEIANLIVGVRYEPETVSLFARMTQKPSDERKVAINNLITSMKSSGAWQKLDALYVLAAQDEQAAKLNWIQDAYPLTSFGGLNFSPSVGYKSDGSTGYLSTGFNPATAGGKYSLNSASAFVFIDPTDSTPGVSGNFFGNTNARVNRGPVSFNTRLNDNAGQVFNTSPIDSLLTVSRLISTEYKLYRGGTLLTTHIDTSDSVSSDIFEICRSAGFYSTARIQMAGFGAGMSAAEISGIALP